MKRSRRASAPRRVLPPPEERRVIELVRCSTPGQANRQTEEIQKQDLDDCRLDRGGTVIERVEEPGISGQTEVEARLFMARLLAHAEDGYDEVRVVAVDRIGRLDAFDIAPLINLIRDAGAVIFDLSVGREIDPCTAQGAKDLSDLLNSARLELEKTRYRTMGGRRRRLFHRGLAPNGGVPWGIILVDEQYRLSADVHAHLSFACDRIAAGRSLRKVCAELSARGVNGPTNRGWGRNGESLRAAIWDDAYLGRWHGTAAGKRRDIPVLDPLDEDLVMAARGALQSRRKRPVDGRTVEALLRGRVSCGNCFGGMNVAPATGSRRYTYYRCPRCLKGANVCHDVERVDGLAWTTLAESVLSDRSLVEALDALEARPPEDDGSIARIEGELDARRRSLDNVLRALGGKEQSDHMISRLGDLDREVREFEMRLREAKRAREAALKSHRVAAAQREGLRERLRALRERLDALDFSGRREVVAALDVHLILHADRWAELRTSISSTMLGTTPLKRERKEFIMQPTSS